MASGSPQTRGFLFADLRDYSAYAETYGDQAAGELIRRYRALVRAEISRFDGAEIRTEGDSFYVVFASVSNAVRAALAVRDAAAAADGVAPIRVGLGVNAGEVNDGEEGIVSSAVNIAARVCSVAAPGEVLVTDTVRSLTRTALSLTFAPRGRRRLKGIAEPITLFAVSEGDRSRTKRGSRVRSAPARIAGATIVTAGVGLVVAVLALGTSPPAERTPLHSSPTTFAVAAVPSATAAESFLPGPTADAFPDAGERVLLERLPTSIATTCRRIDSDDVPVYERTISNAGRATQFMDVPLGVFGGLSCLVDGNRVIYWRSIGSGNIEAVFTLRTTRLDLDRGECAEADARAWQEWQGGGYTGKILCYRAPDGVAAIEWTFDGEPYYASASRLDGDLAALLAWWRENGRLLGR